MFIIHSPVYYLLYSTEQINMNFVLCYNEFIHLVNQDQGVHGLGLLQTLDHLAGHGSYVGPPVSLDF